MRHSIVIRRSPELANLPHESPSDWSPRDRSSRLSHQRRQVWHTPVVSIPTAGSSAKDRADYREMNTSLPARANFPRGIQSSLAECQLHGEELAKRGASFPAFSPPLVVDRSFPSCASLPRPSLVFYPQPSATGTLAKARSTPNTNDLDKLGLSWSGPVHVRTCSSLR